MGVRVRIRVRVRVRGRGRGRGRVTGRGRGRVTVRVRVRRSLWGSIGATSHSPWWPQPWMARAWEAGCTARSSRLAVHCLYLVRVRG